MATKKNVWRYTPNKSKKRKGQHSKNKQSRNKNSKHYHKKNRGQGIGEALLNHAKQFAKKEGSKGFTLETETNNPAQHLYERLGWKKDEHTFHYTWEV